MNERYAKIRKQWLVVFMCIMLQGCVSCFLAFQFNPVLNDVDIILYAMASGVSVTGILGMGYAMYRCIYQKFGTKLVTVLLVFNALSFPVTLTMDIMGNTQLDYYIPYYGIIQVISYGLGFCWIIACWRIRKVNQKLRALSLAEISQ